jgi:hypothetical protein
MCTPFLTLHSHAYSREVVARHAVLAAIQAEAQTQSNAQVIPEFVSAASMVMQALL